MTAKPLVTVATLGPKFVAPRPTPKPRAPGWHAFVEAFDEPDDSDEEAEIDLDPSGLDCDLEAELEKCMEIMADDDDAAAEAAIAADAPPGGAAHGADDGGAPGPPPPSPGVIDPPGGSDMSVGLGDTIGDLAAQACTRSVVGFGIMATADRLSGLAGSSVVGEWPPESRDDRPLREYRNLIMVLAKRGAHH